MPRPSNARQLAAGPGTLRTQRKPRFFNGPLASGVSCFPLRVLRPLRTKYCFSTTCGMFGESWREHWPEQRRFPRKDAKREPGLGRWPVFGGQRRQSVARAGTIALRTRRSAFPGGLQLAARAWACRVDRTMGIHANRALQRDAAQAGSVGHTHLDAQRIELARERRVDASIVDFRPVHGDAKGRATGAAAQAGMGIAQGDGSGN